MICEKQGRVANDLKAQNWCEVYKGVGILLSGRFCVTYQGRIGFSPAQVSFFILSPR